MFWVRFNKVAASSNVQPSALPNTELTLDLSQEPLKILICLLLLKNLLGGSFFSGKERSRVYLYNSIESGHVHRGVPVRVLKDSSF